MTDLFKEILPSILQNKEPVITEENAKDYNPYIVNRALSLHYDTILFANAMNANPGLDPLLQYQYLLNTVRGYRRPHRPWLKRTSGEDLEAVKSYYGFSNEKAREALSLLSKTQVETIKEKMTVGGTNAQSRRVNRSNATKTR